MSRLMITDRDLANLAATPVSIEPDTIELSHTVFLRLVAELRERRAADLSDADREALVGIRNELRNSERRSPDIMYYPARWVAAREALDKLLLRLVERKP